MAWMNGRRTVRCRLCWEKGHNKRNCPTLSPETKARITSGDLARKCSYCGESGHTRPKCAQAKRDKAEYAQRNGAYRRDVLERMVSMGLGIGALVYSGETKDDISELSPSELYMISSIDWEDVQQRNTTGYVLHGVTLAEDGYSNTFIIPPTDNTRAWYKLNVLTRCPENYIRSAPPSDWLTGYSGIDRFFNRKRRS